MDIQALGLHIIFMLEDPGGSGWLWVPKLSCSRGLLE